MIAYRSRTLTAAERIYKFNSGKLDFLVLKWAITEQFQDYLFQAPHFTAYSDNNPLTYVTKSAKLKTAGHRWVAELADYRFTLKYRPGTANRDADLNPLKMSSKNTLRNANRKPSNASRKPWT